MTGNSSILGSALENIIRNAIRFAPEQTEVAVRVSLKESEHKQLVRIVIEDQGPGVPEESLEMLFNPFYRVDDTRGQKNHGTGLGMAIAHRAVQIHESQIGAESKTSAGLRVVIELPLGLS